MSLSRNTSNKASLLTWLPWILLLIVLAALIWLFTSMNKTSESTWEPPRATPVEQQAPAAITDTPAPIFLS